MELHVNLEAEKVTVTRSLAGERSKKKTTENPMAH